MMGAPMVTRQGMTVLTIRAVTQKAEMVDLPMKTKVVMMTATLLFKPFTSLQDLCDMGNGQTWHDAWIVFEPTMLTQSHRIYNNMQDYHVGRKLATLTDMSRAALRDEMEQDDNSEESNDEAFDVFDIEEHRNKSGSQEENVDLASPSGNESDSDESTGSAHDIIISLELNNPVKYPTVEKSSNVDLMALVGNDAMARAAALTAGSYKSVIGGKRVSQILACRQQWVTNVADLCKWVILEKKGRTGKPIIRDEGESGEESEEEGGISATAAILAQNVLHQTRVMLLDNAINVDRMKFRPRHVERGQEPDPLQEFSFVDNVSHAFGLKKRQHIAFVKIAHALLLTWHTRMDVTTDELLLADIIKASAKQQLLLLLNGSGGTGKSHVISAVQAFCIAWKHPRAMAKTAMTGKAAVGIASTVGLACTI